MITFPSTKASTKKNIWIFLYIFVVILFVAYLIFIVVIGSMGKLKGIPNWQVAILIISVLFLYFIVMYPGIKKYSKAIYKDLIKK